MNYFIKIDLLLIESKTVNSLNYYICIENEGLQEWARQFQEPSQPQKSSAPHH